MTNFATLRVNGIRPYASKIVGDVEVSVDLNQIATDIGWKALRNKSGKSTYMYGAVVVKAINRRVEG